MAFVGLFIAVFVGILVLIMMSIVGTTWEFMVGTGKVILVIAGLMATLVLFQGLLLMLGL